MKPQTIDSNAVSAKQNEILAKIAELETLCSEMRSLFPEPDKSNLDSPYWQNFDNATDLLTFLERGKVEA